MSNWTLNAYDTLRRLGLKTGLGITFKSEAIPIVLLSDLSRLIPAPIEPRALTGFNFNPPVGDHAELRMRSDAPGGVFIEALFLLATGAVLTDTWILRNLPSVAATTSSITANTQQFGGTDVISSPLQVSVAAAPSGAELPAGNTGDPVTTPVALFIPNGNFFSITFSNPGNQSTIAMLWREVPAIPGQA